MDIRDMNETIIDFFKSQKLEKIKGILVKDCNDCNSDMTDMVFNYSSKEEFFEKQCQEIYTYGCLELDKSEEFVCELVDVQEKLEDAFLDYVDNLLQNNKINTKDNTDLLKYYNETDLEELVQVVAGVEEKLN